MPASLCMITRSAGASSSLLDLVARQILLLNLHDLLRAAINHTASVAEDLDIPSRFAPGELETAGEQEYAGPGT